MNEQYRPGLLSGALLCLLLTWGAASYAQIATIAVADIDRAEQIGWSDPQAALQRLDKLQPQAQSNADLVQLLTVRGLAYADIRQDGDAQALIARLHAMGRDDPSAEAASHLVQAHLFYQRDQYDRAQAELKLIGAEATLSELERYRLKVLRGSVLAFAGQQEGALMAYEQALDLANAMHSTPRVVQVRLKLSKLFMFTGNLDLAANQIATARRLAEQSRDEAALVGICLQEADIADRRGDQAEDLRVTREALAHAQRVGSDQLLVVVLCDLGDSYMKRGDYTASLGYSRRALELARKLHRSAREQIVLFNMGIAEIGLGHLAEGKRRAESAIQRILANGNPVDAQDMMHEYLPALERAGDWRGAVEVYHRNDKLRDQLLTTAREQALLDLSAKFQDERRAREIELLKRDNAIKSRDLQAQRLRQQMIVMAAVLIALVCGVLGWGISRIRKVNERLRHNSEHDALTGLCNRRYFNEHVLPKEGNRSFVGCALLVDMDYFKRINDTLGHPAGDAVLAAASKRLANTLRDNETLLRWGGEEFLVLLRPMSDAQLNLTAHRLLNAVRSEPVVWHGERIRCTVSIGCASFPITGAAIDVSLDRAISLVDKALYHAKRRGRDRACMITLVNVYSEQELAAINEDFEDAIADRRVQLVETVSATSGTYRTLSSIGQVG